MQNKNEEKEVPAVSTQSYLEAMYQMGAELFVDGEPVMPYEAVHRTVREEFSYMADYVLGESGQIEQIRFDKVDIR